MRSGSRAQVALQWLRQKVLSMLVVHRIRAAWATKLGWPWGQRTPISPIFRVSAIASATGRFFEGSRRVSSLSVSPCLTEMQALLVSPCPTEMQALLVSTCLTEVQTLLASTCLTEVQALFVSTFACLTE
jgi:hypothetical protein